MTAKKIQSLHHPELSYTSVKRIVAAVKGKSSEACLRKPGSGRKRKTTIREDRTLTRFAYSEEAPSENRLAEMLEETTGTKLTGRTVRSRMKEQGINRCVKVKKPYVNDDHRERRLAFAVKYRDWSVAEWEKVLWSDESPFTLRYSPRSWVWRKPDEKWNLRCTGGTVKSTKFCKKLMVWGCFAGSRVGNFYRIRGIMKSPHYHNILVRQMMPSARRLFDGEWYFQQDNDPKHTAGVNKQYLKNKKVKCLLWPAGSPDLSPIENLWEILNIAAGDRKPQNEDELFAILKEAWEALPADTLQHLVESMPRRCQAVIDANGGPTKY